MTNEQIVSATRGLAKLYVERADALGLKGKKRDDEALAYIVGAAQGADAAGAHDLYEHIGRIAYLIVAVRGYIGIKEIAEKEEYSTA